MHNRCFVLCLSGLATGGAVVAIAVSCSDQPAARCTAGRGAYSARYLPTSGPDAGGCVIPGEALFVEIYAPPPQDLSPASIAIGGASIGNAVANSMPDPDPAHTPYSLGRFSTPYPGGDGFCNVPSLTGAEQRVPAKPPTPAPEDAGPDAEGMPGIPATTIRYAWQNVRLYVTPTAPGTQLVGDLTYTVDDCTATYHVQALYPAVPCATQLDDAGTMGPDETLCDPNPAPDKGRPVGSGIGPDLKVVCDPTLLLCVLAGDPPSLK